MMIDGTKEPKDAFVRSILVALEKIGGSESNHDKSKLIFKTLDALKLLSCEDLDGRVDEKQVASIDIFTPILKCDNLHNKWDILASFVALFSIHRELQPLVTSSISSWRHLLPSQGTLLIKEDDSHKRGFYSVVSELTEVESVGPETFEYLKLDLAPTLVMSWVPQWLEWLEKGGKELCDVDILNESTLDFYIATCGEEFAKKYVSQQEKSPLWYLAQRVCLTMVRFQDWIPQNSYNIVAQYIGPRQSEFENIPFALQVVMEVVDHPELNFFETPHLALLLSNALKTVEKAPCNVLHAKLGSLSSVQSLPALINMTQYLLAKFLINTGETVRLINMKSQIHVKPDDSSWYKLKPSLVMIPDWFQKSIMPPVPPISKSSFVFQCSKLESDESCNIERVTNLLFDSLKSVSSINGRLLGEYRALGIDLMQMSTTTTELSSALNHKLKQSSMELYLIPVITTLLLSHQLTSLDNKLIGRTKAQISGRILYFHSLRICEELIKSHAGVGLFYLIEFAAKVSSEDLILQKTCTELLNHLFFHGANNLAKQLCEESALAKEALLDYITIWNDGTETFESFFTQLFGQKQPSVKTASTALEDVITYWPDGEKSSENNKSKSAATKADPTKPSPPRIPYERENLGSSLQQNKFDPYSAMPFVPAKKPARTLVVNTNNKALSHGLHPNDLDNRQFGDFGSDSLMSQSLLNESEEMTSIGGIENLTSKTSAERFNFDLSNSTTLSNTTPRTPNLTTSSLFNSPWNDSPDIHSTPNMCKMVSTGKNYILGGHNRIRNNSRAQSVHIDSFDIQTYGP